MGYRALQRWKKATLDSEKKYCLVGYLQKLTSEMIPNILPNFFKLIVFQHGSAGIEFPARTEIPEHKFFQHLEFCRDQEFCKDLGMIKASY